MDFVSKLLGMADNRKDQLQINDAQSSDNLRASESPKDRDTIENADAQDKASNSATVPLYPDIKTAVPAGSHTLLVPPGLENVKEKGLDFVDNLERQYGEVQELKNNAEKAKEDAAEHQAELDAEENEILAEERKLQERRARHAVQQDRQTEMDANANALAQGFERAQLRFEHLLERVDRLSKSSVNEIADPSLADEDEDATIDPDVTHPAVMSPQDEQENFYPKMPISLESLREDDQYKLVQLWTQCAMIECVGPGEFIHLSCHECNANASFAGDGTSQYFFVSLEGLQRHYKRAHSSKLSRADVWHVCGKHPLSTNDIDTLLRCNETGGKQNVIQQVKELRSASVGSSRRRSETTTPTPPPA